MSSYRVFAHILFVLAACTYTSKATFYPPPCPSPPPPPQSNTMTFYLQVVFPNGTNIAVANTIPVAGIQGKAFSPQQFGTIYVFDVNITTTPSPNSTVLGQSYGNLIVVNQHGDHMFPITYAFTSGKFSGSTMVALGIFNGSQPVGNFSIIGGTKALTYATGYVANQIISERPNFVVKVTANYKIAA